MTDKEIIKALECCAKSKCKKCSFNRHYDTKRTLCTLRLAENALELINRQKAEIERLQSCNKMCVEAMGDQEIELATAKSEAIKEFAERLKEKAYFVGIFSKLTVAVKDIDNLVKEMTEQKE